MKSSPEAEHAELVAYHSERTVGHQYHGTGEDFSFFSAKSEKVLKSALGRRVWVIASTGRQSMRFYLVGHYTPAEIILERDVRYLNGKGMHIQPPVQINDFEWFKALYIEQNNFSYGNFNRIRSRAIVKGIQETLASAVSVYPDELKGSHYYEGPGERAIVNRYERSGEAREACLKYFGTSCFVCGLNLMLLYGEIARDLIHVHHLTAISTIGASYAINPETDLIPICPNCHAVAHRRTPPLTPVQIRKLLEVNKLR